MTRDEVKKLRDKIEAALPKVDGYSLSIGGCSFGTTATFKLIVAPVVNGQAVSKEAEDFTRYAFMFGLEPSMLGKTFRHGGTEFTITGLKPRSPRFPVLASNDRGKGYKFPADTVKILLGK